jgi:hypothetical protein
MTVTPTERSRGNPAAVAVVIVHLLAVLALLGFQILAAAGEPDGPAETGDPTADEQAVADFVAQFVQDAAVAMDRARDDLAEETETEETAPAVRAASESLFMRHAGLAPPASALTADIVRQFQAARMVGGWEMADELLSGLAGHGDPWVRYRASTELARIAASRDDWPAVGRHVGAAWTALDALPAPDARLGAALDYYTGLRLQAEGDRAQARDAFAAAVEADPWFLLARQRHLRLWLAAMSEDPAFTADAAVCRDRLQMLFQSMNAIVALAEEPWQFLDLERMVRPLASRQRPLAEIAAAYAGLLGGNRNRAERTIDAYLAADGPLPAPCRDRLAAMLAPALAGGADGAGS